MGNPEFARGHDMGTTYVELTPAQRRVQAASANAMVAVERQSLRAMRRLLEDVTDDTVAAIARQNDASSDASKAAILSLLILGGKKLRAGLRTRVTRARGDARGVAHDRLNVELQAAGAPLRFGAGLRMPKLHADPAHAVAASDTIAATWQAAGLMNLNAALAAGTSPARAIDATSAAVDGRLRRIAATEVPQAYNDEHRRSSEDIAAELGGDVGLDVLLVRRWDAILDARTCQTCAARDGQVVPLGSSFKSGDEPGFVHPWCRCMSTVVAIPRMRL